MMSSFSCFTVWEHIPICSKCKFRPTVVNYFYFSSLFLQPNYNIAGSHTFNAFEGCIAFEGFFILIEDAGQGAGVLRIGED